MIQYIWLALYLSALCALFIYGMNCYILMICYRLNRPLAVKRHAHVKKKFYQDFSAEGWPKVTIQLPVFNERYVVERLIESVCRFDYPSRLLEIQVLDDSIDDTVKIAGAVVAEMQRRGRDVVYLHRQERSGFKAGALREGLKAAKGDLIAIFDADFIPDPTFLKETIPYFTDPAVGLLQARWGHVNRNYSLLTCAQSMGIDGHFGVEQAARAWSGFFMNFNGTAGIWRKKAIEDAGGWQADTLTEDLDLSYRAQLRGWKLQFAPEVVCPAELPVTITAFKSQQHRWAKGSIQTARKNLINLFRADISIWVKIQAVLHLTHYMVHPMMLMVVLTSIPMLFTPWFFSNPGFAIVIFTMLCLATCGPSCMYLFSQNILYGNRWGRIKFLPLLMFLGTGIAVNNTRAILEALLNIKTGFVRTPKYGIKRKGEPWEGKSYSIPLTAISILEFCMGVYALIALLLFLIYGRFLISPFLLIYTIGFFYVFILSVKHGYGKSQS